MRIALTGAAGQLGQALQNCLADGAIASDLCMLNRNQADLCVPEQLADVLSAFRPDVVINCAAYNKVDQAEEEPGAAFAVNAFGVRNLAQLAARLDFTLAHVSTDYVFGMESPVDRAFPETAQPGPVSVYGTSKLAGEYFARQTCSRSFVIRTCGLYGPAMDSGSGNFVLTMLKLAKQRDCLSIVDDQQCTPTCVHDLAHVITGLIQTDRYGLYHATNAGDTNWYEFATRIFERSRQEIAVTPISSSEYGARARRPKYSVLDCSKLHTTLGWACRPWQEALDEFLEKHS